MFLVMDCKVADSLLNDFSLDFIASFNFHPLEHGGGRECRIGCLVSVGRSVMMSNCMAIFVFVFSSIFFLIKFKLMSRRGSLERPCDNRAAAVGG